MPEYIAERVGGLLKPKAKILVLGVTYKKDVKDLRKSPALDIIDILQRKGFSVSYHDPLIPYLRLNHIINLRSIELTKSGLAKFGCVIIATDHSSVDYDFLLRNSRLIFDARNVYSRLNNSKVVRL